MKSRLFTLFPHTVPCFPAGVFFITLLSKLNYIKRILIASLHNQKSLRSTKNGQKVIGNNLENFAKTIRKQTETISLPVFLYLFTFLSNLYSKKKMRENLLFTAYVVSDSDVYVPCGENNANNKQVAKVWKNDQLLHALIKLN
jgi:hypothetical protein